MASKRTRANKPEMIHCPYCGEDYSSTYKHCPFCDEVEPAEDDYQTDEYDEAPRSRGGKRLVTNTRGGGYGGCIHHRWLPVGCMPEVADRFPCNHALNA